MSFYSVEVAKLRDPESDWQAAGYNWSANVDRLMTVSDSRTALVDLLRESEKGLLPASRQLDWGAWLVPATKQQIVDRFEATVRRTQDSWENREGIEWTREHKLDVADRLSALPESDAYVLLCVES